MSNLERMIQDGSLVDLLAGSACPGGFRGTHDEDGRCNRLFPSCEKCWEAYLNEEVKEP